MKTITPYLLRFALVATILTIIFRFVLSYGIENQSITIIILSGMTYGISMFISGWIIGKKDGEYLPIFDVGFRFHFTTFLVFSVISELWFILGFNSHYEKIKTIHITILIWSILLLIHFIVYLWTRKNSINNLDKNDLFE